ncbi:PHA/PHB synthase family protein [Pseudonocardia hydrocarbonoxydans]|uniref:Class II poly(R)-hydroxyalkanoic acid synthase n=1 Tax=Pseudonocardia hydrocarbonoxydans TaxID=76726 RepID=A0A4Y3WKA6_9PSEU|nr:alpha/beta fold hydrolase [Pseudonocardia hydrocarbonoxydans]GEC18349.1 class II poly(R)-hydroxyalkanoic acid synthase [Pseudonocardia hydrocarbonoxydans]
MTAEQDPTDADVATGLDMLLSDGALGPLRRMLPAAAGLRMAAALAARPVTVTRRGAGLAAELAKIGVGASQVAPSPKDKRYADPAWTENPLLRRLVQAHIAAGGTATDLVEDADLDWADHERVQFAVGNVVDALAPSNSLLNPALWKAARETRGASLVDGAKRLVDDLSTAPRVPSMVEPDAFTVGEDVAATPGAVVLRTPVFELIQYLPQTGSVREIPLLIVPPTINKFYVADLAPGRSIVENLVRNGQQVFLMSWRNPGPEQAAWDLDTYGAAILEAMTACERISRQDATALMAFCSGGMITSMVLGHLAATGAQDRVASVSFAVTVLDQAKAGTTGALLDPETARQAVAASQKKGYLDGRTLAEVFAWLRPNDLIWNYWVNNYLRGKAPKPFDILFWNADTTRMTAGLHRDFIDIAVANALVHPGGTTMLGTPVDLSKVDRDMYIIAGIADHLCAWQSCFRTTQLLGGESRFVLSTSGHIASMVNPPGNPKASFRVAPPASRTPTPINADAWLAVAETVTGSWWPDHVEWLAARSGDEVDAPAELGGRGLHAIVPAPGDYVRVR